MAQKRAKAGKAAAERARARTVAAPGSQEPAQVRRAQIPDILEAGRSGEMPGEEGEELARVALIGFERVVRKASFFGERGEPTMSLGHQRLVGDDEKFVHVLPFGGLSHDGRFALGI